MNTLDQYKASHIGAGALDLWEAAQVIPDMPTTEAPGESLLDRTVVNSDGSSATKPMDDRGLGSKYVEDRAIQLDAAGLVQVGPDQENSEIDSDTSRLLDPTTGQPLEYRGTKTQPGLGQEVDPHVAKAMQAGQSRTGMALARLLKQSAEPDPGFFTKALTLASGQTWSTVKANRASTIADAKQLIDEGKFDQAFQHMNYAAEGITEVTSPLEFVASGGAAAAKIAGKTALKVFAAGAPLEYTGTMVFEEVGEDNMLIGLVGEVASGVLAGNIGQRLVDAAGKAAVNSVSSVTVADVARKLRPESGKDIMEYAWPKSEQAYTAMRAALPGFSFDLADPLNVYSKLGSKRALADEMDYLSKFSLGDVTDYRVRGAYGNLVAELNGQEITPETAGLTRAIEHKLQVTSEPALNDYSAEVTRQLTVEPPRATVIRRSGAESAPAAATGPTESGIPMSDDTPISTGVKSPQEAIDAPIGSVDTPSRMPDTDSMGPEVPEALVEVEAPAAPAVVPPVTLSPDTPLPASNNPKPDYSPFGEPPALNPKQIKALEQETRDEWFGKPKFNIPGMRQLKAGEEYTRAEIDKIHGTIIGQYAARLRKLDSTLTPEQALQQGQDMFYSDLARGIHGEDYKSDVNDLFNTLLSNAKKSGQKVNADELRAKAHEIIYQEYSAEYEKALAKKKASVRAQGGLKTQYIEGYAGNVWEDQNLVELNIKLHPETGSLVYDSAIEPPVTGSGAKSAFKSSNFDYGAIQNQAQAEHAMKQFIHRFENSWTWTESGGKKRRVLPGADRVKGKGWYYDTEVGRTVDTHGLTDDAYIQVAKMYGWDESMLPPHQVFDKNGKQVSYVTGEELATNFAKYNEFEQSIPGWLRSEADQTAKALEDYTKSLRPGQPPDSAKIEKIKSETGADPRYYQAVFGRAGYLKGIKEFLRQKFNLSPDAKPWELTQRVEELALMRSKLVDDIAQATGTPQEAKAKRFYLLFKDKITGSHSLEYSRIVNQARQRELGYYEVLDFQGKRTKNPNLQMEADQGKYGMTDTETPEGQLVDALDNFDADNPAYGDLSLRAPKTADAYEAGLSVTDKTPKADPFAKYAEERKLFFAKQVNELENQFGTRFADEPYGSSALGGNGKFNLFKVNSAADLMLSLERLDIALKETPTFVDVTAKFGLVPKEGMPSQQIAKLGTALSDAQVQMDELAARMISEPNNVVATLGFEKMRAIHQALVDALTVDDISLSAPKLDKYNFMATDDIQMASNFGKQIMDNFVMYSKIGPDTRVSTLMAQMYNSLPTPQAKATFLRQASVLETNNPPMMAKEAIKMRQQLSKMIEDACGRH